MRKWKCKLIRTGVTTQNIPISSLRPKLPRLSPLSARPRRCRCRCHHHHHRPALLSVSGYCSHPTRSFPPVAHSPTTHFHHQARPPLRGAPSFLYLLSLGRQTKQADGGHRVSQTGRQTSSRQLTEPETQVSKDSVTRLLASCNILCNTIPQLAHATVDALQYPQLVSSAIPAPRLGLALSLAHRAAAAS